MTPSSVAYAGKHADQTLGVINFVGGWLGDACAVAETVNQTLFARRTLRPADALALWPGRYILFDVSQQKSFAAFEAAGGRGRFLEFEMPSEQGHQLVRHPELWNVAVGDYVGSL